MAMWKWLQPASHCEVTHSSANTSDRYLHTGSKRTEPVAFSRIRSLRAGALRDEACDMPTMISNRNIDEVDCDGKAKV